MNVRLDEDPTPIREAGFEGVVDVATPDSARGNDRSSEPAGDGVSEPAALRRREWFSATSGPPLRKAIT